MRIFTGRVLWDTRTRVPALTWTVPVGGSACDTRVWNSSDRSMCVTRAIDAQVSDNGSAVRKGGSFRPTKTHRAAAAAIAHHGLLAPDNNR